MLNYDKEYDRQKLQLFLFWIAERYLIHLKKDVQKLPAPWTDDIYLQTYSFTNVRRIQDRVSKYVLQNICNNNQLLLQQKILNIIWFRIFNQPRTFQLFKFPIHLLDLQEQFQCVHNKYAAMIPEGVSLSRGAYMNSGVMNAQYDDVKGFLTTLMPWHIIWSLYKDTQKFNKLISNIKNNQGQAAFDIINGLRGIGQFLAYQIYIDLSYCQQIDFTEYDFVYLGPGAKRGVKAVFPNVPLKMQPSVIEYMSANINRLLLQNHGFSLIDLMTDLPQKDRRISLSNMQNCFCQFSKYMVLASGQKKKILKYGRNN